MEAHHAPHGVAANPDIRDVKTLLDGVAVEHDLSAAFDRREGGVTK